VSLDKSKEALRKADALRLLKLTYTCEWPLEIVIDKSTISKKYNQVFKLLL